MSVYRKSGRSEDDAHEPRSNQELRTNVGHNFYLCYVCQLRPTTLVVSKYGLPVCYTCLALVLERIARRLRGWR